jgi:hypothetical protein
MPIYLRLANLAEKPAVFSGFASILLRHREPGSGRGQLTLSRPAGVSKLAAGWTAIRPDGLIIEWVR